MASDKDGNPAQLPVLVVCKTAKPTRLWEGEVYPDMENFTMSPTLAAIAAIQNTRQGNYRLERPGRDTMRIPDGFLDSVGFIGEVLGAGTSGDDIDLCGTGFFVNYRIRCQARHVIFLFCHSTTCGQIVIK